MAIEFYNEGLAPKGMCELINQIVPRSRNRFKMLFKNRVEERCVSGCICYKEIDGASWIKIYPTVIQLYDKSYKTKISGTRSFNLCILFSLFLFMSLDTTLAIFLIPRNSIQMTINSIHMLKVWQTGGPLKR